MEPSEEMQKSYESIGANHGLYARNTSPNRLQPFTQLSADVPITWFLAGGKPDRLAGGCMGGTTVHLPFIWSRAKVMCWFLSITRIIFSWDMGLNSRQTRGWFIPNRSYRHQLLNFWRGAFGSRIATEEEKEKGIDLGDSKRDQVHRVPRGCDARTCQKKVILRADKG